MLDTVETKMLAAIGAWEAYCLRIAFYFPLMVNGARRSIWQCLRIVGFAKEFRGGYCTGSGALRARFFSYNYLFRGHSIHVEAGGREKM